MPSRMEKYYQTDNTINRRTNKNKDLYNEIHNNLDYNSIKPVSNINEISPAKLNEMLKNENRIEPKTYQVKNKTVNIEENEDSSYDINEALERAKSNSVIKSDYHKLKEEQLNLLKKIESYKASKQEQDENLNELLNTIASTKLLNDLNDRDLSLGLLGDLKSGNENTVVGGIDSINKVMHDIPKVKLDDSEKNEIDRSFYTSSMNFNDEDFDDIKEIKNKLRKNNSLMKIMIVGIALIVIIAIILILILI